MAKIKILLPTEIEKYRKSKEMYTICCHHCTF